MPADIAADLPADLRAALTDADFTVDAVAELLGEEAHRALGRNETTPGVRRTTDGSALSTLIRLFLLQVPVATDDAQRALPGLVDRLCNAGLLKQSVSEVAARTDCRPYATEDRDLWVVSDLTPGLDGAPVRPSSDYVLGISSASTSLAQLTSRGPVDSALDLGTGCGVQALHLATHSKRVVATDVNQRALWMTRLNAALNEVEVEVDVRDGSYFEPVAAERFDLIATNPPFVISPATGERLVYRDSGLPGDRIVEDIVRAAPEHLTEQGLCQVLGNWVVLRDQDWDERLAGWLTDDIDAVVIQRELVDPSAYVELWLKDEGAHGGPDYVRRYDTWLSWFDQQGVEGVGFGWINLRNGGSGRHRFEQWPYGVEQPIGGAIADDLRAMRTVIGLGDRLTRRDDVIQETRGPVGVEDPETIVLRQQRGFRRARTVDTVEAALVGASDGDLSVDEILRALSQLLESDDLVTTYLPVVRELFEDGFLIR